MPYDNEMNILWAVSTFLTQIQGYAMIRVHKISQILFLKHLQLPQAKFTSDGCVYL